MTLTPYINLAGNAEEAMNFYKEIFDGKIETMLWKDIPENEKMPISDDWQNKIMHGSLVFHKDVTLYFSDSILEEKPKNNSVFMHLVFDSEEELRRVYKELSVGGKVNMPVNQTFWGSVYGDLIDKFGTCWGLEFPIQE